MCSKPVSHLSYYEVLGLDAPPADRRAVKRAYSKQLKITRPEDDPDGFMRLRDAHDFALHILAQETENLTYATMIQDAAGPESEAETVDTAEPEDTTYAIGGPRGFDAPVQEIELTPVPEPEPEPEPKQPPLYEELKTVINFPEKRNNRNAWNQLFRRAKQLDIDAYVDFENMVLEAMLQVQGFYDYDDPLHSTPDRMPLLFEPSITASMFRTLSWDQVSRHNAWKTHRIAWLEQRMRYRPAGEPAQVMNTEDSDAPNGMNFLWGFLGLAFFFAQFLRFIVNS